MQRYRFLLIADKLTKNELTGKLTQSGQETLAFSGRQEDLPAVMRSFCPHMVILQEQPAVRATAQSIQTVKDSFDGGVIVVSANARDNRGLYTDAGADIVIQDSASAVEIIQKTYSYVCDNEQRVMRSMPEVTYSAEVYERICSALSELEITPNYCGYGYIRDILEMLTDSSEDRCRMTKSIYPSIARSYGTTSSCVERGIRTVINKSWQRMSSETKVKYFGLHSPFVSKSPTNSQFIFIVAERISRQIRLDRAVIV